MPKIQVARPLTLTLNSGEQKHYLPGTYDVSDEVANHPYTKHHLATDEENPVYKHPHEGETTPLHGPGLTPETALDADDVEKQQAIHEDVEKQRFEQQQQSEIDDDAPKKSKRARLDPPLLPEAEAEGIR